MSSPSAHGFKRFALLLDRLALTPSRNGKLRWLVDYLEGAGSERERGFAMAVLTGELDVGTVSAARIRGLTRTRTDGFHFKTSYAYVGDLAETVSLLWPDHPTESRREGLAELIDQVKALTPLETLPFIDRFLDGVEPVERWAFVKLVTGASLRIGMSARLAKTGLAQWADRDLEDVEKVWAMNGPPYDGLFEWIRSGGPVPVAEGVLHFHPMLLANPMEWEEMKDKQPSDYWAEWKWDGIRVQWVSSRDGKSRLFSRTGEDISAAFPELVNGPFVDAVLDGECLVRRSGLGLDTASMPENAFSDVAPFQDLQKRLGRKAPGPTLLTECPAFLCLYDLLICNGEDLRDLPLEQRRKRLEFWFAEERLERAGFRLSPMIPIESWQSLEQLRARTREWDLEGFMIKNRKSTYRSGRPQGFWYKWKRDPLHLDAVMLYAERGHGKRASFFSDYTFGVWDGDDLVPVGKAYSGFTDEELQRLDKWIRENTLERYGSSVRAVKPELVLEVAFDAVQTSTRHRSGVAMRFPRVHRIRWDKPAAEADHLRAVRKWLPGTRIRDGN